MLARILAAALTTQPQMRPSLCKVNDDNQVKEYRKQGFHVYSTGASPPFFDAEKIVEMHQMLRARPQVYKYFTELVDCFYQTSPISIEHRLYTYVFQTQVKSFDFFFDQLMGLSEEQRAALYYQVIKLFKIAEENNIITNKVSLDNIGFKFGENNMANPTIDELYRAFYATSTPEEVKAAIGNSVSINAIKKTYDVVDKHGYPTKVTKYTELNRVMQFIFALETCAVLREANIPCTSSNITLIMSDESLNRFSYERLRKERSLYSLLYDAIKAKKWNTIGYQTFGKFVRKFAKNARLDLITIENLPQPKPHENREYSSEFARIEQNHAELNRTVTRIGNLP